MFGYKVHVKQDLDLGLIRDLEATAASVHNSRVDLSLLGEVAYRDKDYFGVEPRGYDATMRRGVRGHPLGVGEKLRNMRISFKRIRVEGVRCAEARLRLGPRAGVYCREGSGQDGVRVSASTCCSLVRLV